jgi:predicted MFS family arabinose efflux permease
MIWGIAALFYLYELVLRISPSVMTDSLVSTFGMTSTGLGILVSFYYYSYTALQLPCGVILDKLGPRNLLAISSCLCVIGSLLFAGSGQIGLAQMGRFLVGAGSACAFVSCLQIASHLFRRERFVIVVGLTNVMGILGSILGGFPVAKLASVLGWQRATYALALLGGAITLLILMFIPKKITGGSREANSTMSTLGGLLKNPQIILTGIVTGLMYLPISAFAELWAIPFFMSKHGLNNEEASIAPAVMFGGVIVGSIIMAMIARRIASYTRTIRRAAFCVAILFVPLVYCNGNLWVSLTLVLMIGFFTGGQVLGFTCAKNSAAPETSGTTIALTNCIVMLLGSLFQPILGAMLDFFWDGITGDGGIRIYDIWCYRKAITIIPVLIVVSYILSIFMKETIHLEKE